MLRVLSITTRHSGVLTKLFPLLYSFVTNRVVCAWIKWINTIRARNSTLVTTRGVARYCPPCQFFHIVANFPSLSQVGLLYSCLYPGFVVVIAVVVSFSFTVHFGQHSLFRA